MKVCYDVSCIDHRDRYLVGRILLDGPADLVEYVEERYAAGDRYLSIRDEHEREVGRIVASATGGRTRTARVITPRVSDEPTSADRRSGMGRRP